MKIIQQNKKAVFDYHIEERFEAGSVLRGSEVKAIRAGEVNLTGSFGHIHDGKLHIINMHIAPYSHAYDKNDEETRRSRALLVHKRELNKLSGALSRKGVTLIPLKIYLNERGLVKVEMGLGKHKKAFEQKEALREKDIKRETARELKGVFKY
jgi:SsrA-binding protein